MDDASNNIHRKQTHDKRDQENFRASLQMMDDERERCFNSLKQGSPGISETDLKKNITIKNDLSEEYLNDVIRRFKQHDKLSL